MELDSMEGDEVNEEEEDWNDTRWAVPQNDPLSIKMPSDVGKLQPDEVGESKVETESSENAKQSGLMSRMEINDHKAGMQGLDREKINQIIFETSKGSKFFENEKKKEEQVNKRIEEQKRKLDKVTDLQIQQGLVEIDKLLAELEESRDLSRSIVHIDMDAFYAAVEERDDPSLKEKPMAVGGMGMLSTSNYHARKYGVRAGMPGFIGKKLCPDLVLVGLNFEKYTAVSNLVREIMGRYDPNFCSMSLDEAYLDFTDHMSLRKETPQTERTFYYRPDDCYCCCIVENLDFDFEEQYNINKEDAQQILLRASVASGKEKDSEKTYSSTLSNSESGTDSVRNICTLCGKSLPDVASLRSEQFGTSLEDAVHEMRFRIHQKTKLTASAGIAANTMLAKVGSDRNKPNGQFMVPFTVEAVREFIKDLPIRKISGIGKVSEKMLSAIGIKTCSDLLAKRGILYHLFSSISFNYFMRIALGIGSTKIVGDDSYKRKSYSNERTFGEISKPAELFKKCLELCESLCEGLKKENIKGKTVTLKIKTVKFAVKTKAQSLMSLTNDFEPIYTAARDLLRSEIEAVAPHPLKLRLMGVRLSNLVDLDEAGGQKQGTITDILKKMRSSPQKTKTSHAQASDDLASTQLEFSSTQDLTTVTQCKMTGASENPVQHSSRNEEMRVAEKLEPDVVCESVPSTSKDLTKTTNVLKEKESAGPTKKSVVDMLRAQASSTLANFTEPKLAESHSVRLVGNTKVAGSNSEVQPMKSDSVKIRSEVIPYPENSVAEPRTNDLHKESDNMDAQAALFLDYSEENKTVEKSEEAYECPVCGRLLEGYSSHKISLHVDECLAVCEENNNGESHRDISNADNCNNHGSASSSTATAELQDSVKPTEKNTRQNTPKSTKKSAKKTGKTPQRPKSNNVAHDLNESLLICPVCDLEQDTFDLVAFNKHVDSCLSKATIRQIVRQQDKEFPGKRLNPSAQDKDTPPKKKIKVGTIDSFFRR